MTKVTFPPIEFNYTFKTKKEAKQTAIKAFMRMINDVEILSEFKVEVSKKLCKNSRKIK